MSNLRHSQWLILLAASSICPLAAHEQGGLVFGMSACALAAIISTIIAITLLRRRSQERRALSGMIGDVRSAAKRVRSACAELAAGSVTVAKGATDQAAQLLESSSSLEELRAMVERSDDNGTAANRLCQQAGRSVGDMRQAMDRLNEAVREIQSRAQAVNGVLGHIREITTQTGLLAVNAGLEAVRAGEAGRGFAVVANEVGLLANDASSRAQHISSLVSASREGAELGAQLAKSVDQALQATLAQMGEIARLVDAIVKAGREQVRGMTQISQTVTSMDVVTQGTAVSAEEMARNAGELARLADALDATVLGLTVQVSDDVDASPPPAVPPPVAATASVVSAPARGVRGSKSAAEDSFWAKPSGKAAKPPPLGRPAPNQPENTDNFVPFSGAEGDP